MKDFEEYLEDHVLCEEGVEAAEKAREMLQQILFKISDRNDLEALVIALSRLDMGDSLHYSIACAVFRNLNWEECFPHVTEDPIRMHNFLIGYLKN